MEDIYTIKVKTKPDTRNLYPSERRYSASTVSGLAWVHIALAATSFLLACLALVNPNSDITRITLNDTQQRTVNANELFNLTDDDFTGNYSDDVNMTETITKNNASYILVVAPTLLTVFALAAGIASIMASVRWYIDNNITWLFAMSVLSTIFSLVSFVMVAAWFVSISEGDISDFYKDKILFKDIIIVKHTDVIEKNESHLVIRKTPEQEQDNSHLFTNRVLSINVLIAAFLELLWSILSVKISFKGMRNNYRDDEQARRGNCISVVTTIKGNNTKNFHRNGKLLPPKPDLIEHYPSRKIKKIMLAQGDNSFYLKGQNKNAKQTETSSEFYKERMMNFLNRCASLEGISNPELRTPSVQSECILNPIPEGASVDVNIESTPAQETISSVSWGDTPDHTVYNQNTLNLEKIFNFVKKTDAKEEKENVEISENID